MALLPSAPAYPNHIYSHIPPLRLTSNNTLLIYIFTILFEYSLCTNNSFNYSQVGCRRTFWSSPPPTPSWPTGFGQGLTNSIISNYNNDRKKIMFQSSCIIPNFCTRQQSRVWCHYPNDACTPSCPVSIGRWCCHWGCVPTPGPDWFFSSERLVVQPTSYYPSCQKFLCGFNNLTTLASSCMLHFQVPNHISYIKLHFSVHTPLGNNM
jgi:hypothetical protein